MKEFVGKADRPAWGNHVLGMDGLRGLAALGVLVGHVGGTFAVGVVQPFPLNKVQAMAGTGLTLFFALSGFLLYRGFAAAIVSPKKPPSLRRYFGNRALRILPAYVVILVIVRLLVGVPSDQVTSPVIPLDANSQIDRLTDPLLWLMNVTMLHNLFPWSFGTGLIVSWTLTVELVFYVIMPLTAMAALALARRLRANGHLLALLPPLLFFSIGIAFKIFLGSVFHPTSPDEETYLLWGTNWTAVFARSFLPRADLFAFGMLAAAVWALGESGRFPLRKWVAWIGLGLSGPVLMLMKGTIFHDTGWAAVWGAVIFFVAVRTVGGRPGLSARALESWPLRGVGTISYSLYLWHLPLIWMLDHLGLHFPVSPGGYWANVGLTLAIALILSTVTYHLIEKPALRFKLRTDGDQPRRRGPAAPGTASVVTPRSAPHSAASEVASGQ